MIFTTQIPAKPRCSLLGAPQPVSRPSHPVSRIPSPASRAGFTLIEIMVSLTIMVTAVSIVWLSFSNVIHATQKGEKMLDQLHHGDFVMEQLVSAFRSAAYFNNKPKQFEFWLEDETSGSFDADIVSWVTSSSAFIPPRNPLANQLHRIFVSIEKGEDGENALGVSAYPYIVDLEDPDVEEVEPWIISSKIRGFNCRVYVEDEEDWDDEWEYDNSIPQFVELTLFVEPINEDDDPIAITRMVELPMGVLAKRRNRNRTTEGSQNAGQNDPNATQQNTNINGGVGNAAVPGGQRGVGNQNNRGGGTPSPRGNTRTQGGNNSNRGGGGGGFPSFPGQGGRGR